MRKLLLFIWLIPGFLSAQSYQTILALGDQQHGLTARNMAVGNTMGAIGSDFSVFHTVNPAGIAKFRSNDFAFSVSNDARSVTSSFQTVSNKENNNDFNLHQFGLTFTNPRSVDRVVFGISFTRLQNYDNQFAFEGRSRGSITDRFLEFAQGVNPDDFYLYEEGIAFDVGAIYYDNDENNFSFQNDFEEGQINTKGEQVSEEGSMSELAFGVGFDFKEQLKFGLSLGIPIVNYSIQKNYYELDAQNAIPVFNELYYDYSEDISGAGVNLKLGVHFKPTNFTTLGIGFQTPSIIGLTQEWRTYMGYGYTQFEGTPDEMAPVFNEDETNLATSEFSMVTPLRFDISASHIFRKKGFIAGGVELVNYPNSRFIFEEDDTNFESILNDEIDENLRPVFQFRLGGEYLINKFRVRLGTQISTSPLVDDTNITTSLNGGVGFSTYGFYIDLGYRYTMQNTTYAPYLTANSFNPLVENDTNISLFMLTTGFRF